MVEKYITTRTFNDMKVNTEKLIGILNHNMTKMKVDICWLKVLAGWQIGILVAILGAIITIAINI